jgi:hypothetical protein
MQYNLCVAPLQVEDGTWRIVIFGGSRDVVSRCDQPFNSREEAIAAIKGLEDIRLTPFGGFLEKS